MGTIAGPEAVGNPLVGDEDEAPTKKKRQPRLSQYDFMADISGQHLDTQIRKQERSNGSERRRSLSAFEKGEEGTPIESSVQSNVEESAKRAEAAKQHRVEVKRKRGGKGLLIDNLHAVSDEVNAAIADVKVAIPFKIKLSKRILLGSNMIFFLLGLIMMVGAATVASSGSWSAFLKQGFLDVMLIYAASVIFVSLLGLVGTWRDLKGLLCPYLLAVVVILIMQIVGVSLIYSFDGSLTAAEKGGFDQKSYSSTEKSVLGYMHSQVEQVLNAAECSIDETSTALRVDCPGSSTNWFKDFVNDKCSSSEPTDFPWAVSPEDCMLEYGADEPSEVFCNCRYALVDKIHNMTGPLKSLALSVLLVELLVIFLSSYIMCTRKQRKLLESEASKRTLALAEENKKEVELARLRTTSEVREGAVADVGATGKAFDSDDPLLLLSQTSSLSYAQQQDAASCDGVGLTAEEQRAAEERPCKQLSHAIDGELENPLSTEEEEAVKMRSRTLSRAHTDEEAASHREATDDAVDDAPPEVPPPFVPDSEPAVVLLSEVEQHNDMLAADALAELTRSHAALSVGGGGVSEKPQARNPPPRSHGDSKTKLFRVKKGAAHEDAVHHEEEDVHHEEGEAATRAAVDAVAKEAGAAADAAVETATDGVQAEVSAVSKPAFQEASAAPEGALATSTNTTEMV
jgi:hypothetical protein